MSYEIGTEIFLGIPFTEVIDFINPDKTVDLHMDGVFIAIDDSFVKRYDEIRARYGELLTLQSEKLMDYGFRETHLDGPNGVTDHIAKFLLLCGGIDPGVLSDSYYNGFSELTTGILVVPFKDLIYLDDPGLINRQFDYILVPRGLLSLVAENESKNNILSVVWDGKDSEQTHQRVIEAKINVLESTRRLVARQLGEASGELEYSGYANEGWLQDIFLLLLNSEEIYCGIEVISTRYGTVEDLGGMERDVPYLIYDGRYEPMSWEDPRKEEGSAETIAAIEELFYGADKLETLGFEKYCPKFGG